jgi:hypothetical protein
MGLNKKWFGVVRQDPEENRAFSVFFRITRWVIGKGRVLKSQYNPYFGLLGGPGPVIVVQK